MGERGSFRVKFGVEPGAAVLETSERGSGRTVTNHLRAPGACRFGLAEVSDSRGASVSYSTPLEAGGELEIAASGLRPNAPATLRLRGQAGEHRRTTAAGGLEASLPIDPSRATRSEPSRPCATAGSMPGSSPERSHLSHDDLPP